MLTRLLRRKRAPLTLLSTKMLREMPGREWQDAVRRLCVNVRMSDGMTLCRTLGRYKMFVDEADFGLSPHLMLDGYWEMWVTRAVLATVRDGMVVADVGANLGYYTLLLADLAGPSGHVHAFEPNPRAERLLQRSVVLNGFAERVTRHAEPLGARGGDPVRLVVPSGEPKNAYVSGAPHAAAPGALVHDLRTACLDDVIGDAGLDFVKIDAEGAERDIWHGMQRIVARGRPLTMFMEFVADRYRDPDLFLAEFAARQFTLSRIDPRRGRVAASAKDVLDFPSDVDQMLALSR